jgi:hypothetical protein
MKFEHKGHELTIDLPFEAGYVLNAIEAKVFNVHQLNRAKHMLSQGSFATQAEKQAALDNYTIKIRASRDPIAEEARKIARGIVAEVLNSKGIDINNLKTIQFRRVNSMIESVLEQKPEIYQMAERKINTDVALMDGILSE